MDIVRYNREAWDRYVEKGDRWTIPVSDETIAAARAGSWSIVLTPVKPVPHSWFPPIGGLKILGLASGGGQQCPVLAALGAEVTVFDNSGLQLDQDRTLSERHGLGIRTVQGDMRDLSVFADGSFDLVFNPCSVLFTEEVTAVWKECARVLRPGGVLMTGMMNPVALQLREEDLRLVYRQPYSDLASLPEDALDALRRECEPLIFGHSVSDLLGGQMKAGLLLDDLYEDDWGGTHKTDEFLPAFIATRAIKK